MEARQLGFEFAFEGSVDVCGIHIHPRPVLVCHLCEAHMAAERARPGARLKQRNYVLDFDAVTEIRRRLEDGEDRRDLAEEYGVTPNHLRKIQKGEVRREPTPKLAQPMPRRFRDANREPRCMRRLEPTRAA
jgi:hypothetical protein